jgi:hypothetical protein
MLTPILGFAHMRHAEANVKPIEKRPQGRRAGLQT